MDLISILTTVILATTIGTVIVGVAAYAAFKLRDKRKPKAKKVDANASADKEVADAIFLKKYVPAAASSPALVDGHAPN
jgi:heme/copper-type cytochrome/quinol oxidase subunit 2